MASNATDSEYDFVRKPSRDFFCPVTFELLTDPRQTNSCCGRHLSRQVAEKLEAEGKPCPLCKKMPLKTADDLFFKRKVMELHVRCSNRHQGCAWVGELRHLESHLEVGSVEGQCQFVDVECPLICGQRIRRGELKKHQSNECAQRPFICEYCDYESTYEKVTENHWPQCQRFPMKCPNNCTGNEIERRFLQNHLEEECPQQEIDCKFSIAGCQAKVKRQLMCKHLEESKDEHLDTLLMLARSMENMLTAMQIAFTQIAPNHIFVPPPEMVIRNFEKFKKIPWHSPAFHTHIGGYKMCLNIDSTVWDDGISVGICMMKGEFDSHLQWPFKGEITVQLINQAEGGEHYECKLVDTSHATAVEKGYNDVFKRVTESDRSSKRWGVKEFISHANLYKPDEGKEYLKNDTLKFRVTKVVVTSV